MQNINIDISIQYDEWKNVPDLRVCTEDIIKKTLSTFSIEAKEVEVSILLTNNAFIKELNKKYREKDKPTNVLSFPQTENSLEFENMPFISLGDIIMAHETIESEAQEQSKTFKDHYTHMLVHSCLHLLHYDHQTNADAQEMETLEIEILEKSGIKNPYLI